VSCCLKPEHEPEKLMGSIFRGRNKPETGLWATPFDYCRAVCRTTARSTQHENAFILDRKHCFSKLGRPHVPVPPVPPLPPHIHAVAGQPGQSCDVACAAKQMACSGGHFASLNDCNSLRAKFMCEAGGTAIAASWQREAFRMQCRAVLNRIGASWYCPYPTFPLPGIASSFDPFLD
jgi:hypothetical protein